MEDFDICMDCSKDLPRIHRACRCCALPIASDMIDLCGTCQRTPPPYDNAYAVFQYQFPVNRLITQFKFHGKLVYARLLGQLMAQSLESSVSELPECIVPVPLHSQRISQRGFNQSLQLARQLSRSLGIALDVNTVTRTRPTAPQTGLPEKERCKNVKGSFHVSTDIQSKHVAIVDDVMTTGSTVGELARALKRTGVQRVDVWALART